MNLNNRIVLNYDLWNACNLKCKFCYNDNKRNIKQSFKSIIDIEKDLSNLVKQSDKIFFIWWEPLFHPHIFEILEFADKVWFNEISIVTNWLKMININFTNKLLSKNIKCIIFSIHAHNEELDSDISSRKNIFKKRLEALDNFFYINKEKKYYIWYDLNIVLNKLNINFIDKIIDFYYNIWFRRINLYWMLIHNNMSFENLKIIPYYSKIIDKINVCKKNINLELWIHWLPLCISSKINTVNLIREIENRYIYNIWNNWNKLFDDQINYKSKLNECKKCFAYWKFCFWVYKWYYKKYWDKEFKSISKKELYSILKNKLSNKQKLILQSSP